MSGSGAGRARLVAAGRVLFLVAVAAATVAAFHGHGHEVLDAATATPPSAVAGAGVLVLAGLLMTGVVWRGLLGAYGVHLPGPAARAVFFVGQLGKYVPGGLWSIGAQAHLAGPHDVPPRVTAGASLVFLGVNVSTAGVVVGAALASPSWPTDVPAALGVLLAVASLLSLLPAVVNRLGTLVAGRSGRLALTLRRTAALTGLMVLTWLCYGGAVLAVVPHRSASLLVTTVGAFAASYVVGVVVVVAPAGVGAREATLVALLTPVTGVGAAGAVSILTRLLHTAADLLLAAASWGLARRARVAPAGPPGEPPRDVAP